MLQINPSNFWLDELRLTQQIESGLRRLGQRDIFPQAGVLLEKFTALIGQLDDHISIVKNWDPKTAELEA